MKMPDTAFVALNSSALACVAYDDGRQHLHVEFRDGSLYVYCGVPSKVYEELMTAESQGGYFNTQIRDAFVSVCKGFLG